MPLNKKTSLFLMAFLISFSFFGNGSAVASTEIQRKKAISLLKTTQYSIGLQKLQNLAKKGDAPSYYVLGVLHLSGKFFKANANRALMNFESSAELCYPKAIETLIEVFYNKRGSKYFNPARSLALRNKCNANIIDKAEPASSKTNIPKTSKIIEQSQNDGESDINATGLGNDVKAAWLSVAPRSAKSITGGGSGVAINEGGLFITNEHVTRNCSNPHVIYNGLEAEASVILVNERLDLAVLKVEAPTPFYARFDSTSLKVGEKLVAIGYPVGAIFGEAPSVSEGILTNAEDSENAIRNAGFLLVSIPMASGNSGGPVINQYGGLRGIVSYGWDSSKLAEDTNLGLSSNNLNFIVSGLRISEWLGKRNLKTYSLKTKTSKLDTEEIASKGIKSLVEVRCH